MENERKAKEDIFLIAFLLIYKVWCYVSFFFFF